MPTSSKSPIELVEAVRDLTQVVKALDILLREEYPKRTEVERRFVSRKTASRRAWTVIALILATVVASYFFSIGTVSYCFLGNTVDPPAYCNIMPGYNHAVKKNNRLIKIFNGIVKTTETNSKRIAKLESQG